LVRGLDRLAVTQIAGIGVSGNRHATGNAAVSAVAAQPRLHGHHTGQESGRADRAAEGAGDGGEKQPDGEPVFRITGLLCRLQRVE
jgi:hypothetical protein